MSGAKIGRRTRGEGEKVSMLSNDRLLKEIAQGSYGRNKPKCIKELMERGFSKDNIDNRVSLL